MNAGRAVGTAVLGLLLFLFLAIDLVLFGVVPLNSVVVTVLPLVGLLLGGVLGALVPKAGAPPAAQPANSAAVPPSAPRSSAVPLGPPSAAGAVPSFMPTHTVPAGGMPAWTAPDANGPVVATVAPGVPVRVVGWQGEWAQIHCDNGWEAWVNGRSLVSGPGASPGPARPTPPRG